jgi:hypothetical protein
MPLCCHCPPLLLLFLANHYLPLIAPACHFLVASDIQQETEIVKYCYAHHPWWQFCLLNLPSQQRRLLQKEVQEKS